MNTSQLRAFWAARQGLLEPIPNLNPADVLQRTGWARSVGGVNPYLTLFARAGSSREKVDRAAANLEICELPSARGCTYVVPRADFALALKVGQSDGDSPDIKSAKKHLGVTERELAQLAEQVLAVLEDGPKDPASLKDCLGGAVRNLGAEGKKRGMTTTLPLVLGRLQSLGEVRRQPVHGRLDQQRYSYARWTDSPLRNSQLSFAEAYAELARRYFRFAGPASLAHFRWFSGLGAAAAKTAVASLGLVPIEADSELLIFPDELPLLHSFIVPKDPIYRLVGSLDGIVLHRREVAPLCDPADLNRKAYGDRGIVELGGLSDLTSHPIFDRGRIIGLWEYEPASRSIVSTCFVKQTPLLRSEIDRTAAFVREQLGDARSFSLDSPESRQPRIDALRSAAT